jgi:uncharacterized protein YndB with AHSA1/START domain
VFDAPRELVWKVWTDPAHVAQWWGAPGMTTRVDELNFRPGGTWRSVMVAPDGSEFPQSGVFSEVVAPERIVTSAEFDYGADTPHRMVLTYKLDDLGEKTKMTMVITHATVEMRREHEAMGVVERWNLNFDSLVDYLLALVS